MRVLVNQLPALGQKTGVGHYTSQLLRCFRGRNNGNQIDSFPTGWMREACRSFHRTRALLNPAPGACGAFRRSRSWHRQVLQLMRRSGRAIVGRYFRAACARGGYDLYHDPNFVPFASNCPTVVTLHDLSVLLHPEWHPADRIAYYERHFGRSIQRCDHFIAVSEFGRQEVIRTLGVSPERVTRVYNGIRPGFRPLPDSEVTAALRHLNLPPSYLLCVGTIEPRKNLLLLLRAYCSLPSEDRAACPLLLIGNWGWKSSEVAAYFHDEARHRGALHLGYVRDRHLPAIYNGARALVYPSHYEGFGLPPLEMMACGGAVLASTAGAIAETVGRKGHLISPHDFDGWRAALARVMRDDDWRSILRHGTRAVAQPFTWERCAAETVRVYQGLCNRRYILPMPTYRSEAARRAAA
jgi:alpha-1,3-rhamnosyl/mannosyltransferase